MIQFIAFAYIIVLVYLSNIEQVTGKTNAGVRLMQYGIALATALLALSGLSTWLVPADQSIPISSPLALLFGLFAGVATVFIIWLIHSPVPHLWLVRWLRMESDHGDYSYDSSLSVHRTALILAIFEIIVVFWSYVFSGGLEGVAGNLQSLELAIFDLFLSQGTYVIVALVGVGWTTRRDISDVLSRLGLTTPMVKDALIGIGAGIVFIVILQVSGSIWQASVPPEVLEQQTAASQQMFLLFNSSLFLGFLLALLSGIGEEILFRGALQPIFGLIPTAVFFTLLHVQYTLTPATLILFIIAIGFGLLRQRRNTTTAIFAHITYNFIPFLLYTLSSMQTGSM